MIICSLIRLLLVHLRLATYAIAATLMVSSPKPVFHVQGRKSSSHAHKSQSAGKIDPQHKELVKYIHETWKCVKREYERDGVTSATSCLKGSAAEKSAEPVRRTLAKDFQPFDLEAFWGRRLFEKLTN